MRLGVLVALLGLSTGVARAESGAYVDTNRVRTTATEPLRLDAEFRSDQATRAQAISKAFSAAQAAKPEASAAAWDAYRKAEQENGDAIKKHAEEVDAAFLKRVGEILAKLRADKHVAITAAAGVVMVPGVDLTAEVIARWDAADVKGRSDELAKAKAEIERLKAEAARPPSPTPTPPSKAAKP